jgi:peptidoglycan/LPS O-acetylase OafA/YrhL
MALALSVSWRPLTIGPPQGTGSIVTGCLLALSFEWLRNHKLFVSGFFSLLLVPAIAFRLHLWSVHREFHGLDHLINLLIALLIFRSVVIPHDFFGRVLNSSVLSFVGVLSYSIYVWQQMFLLYSPERRGVFPWNIIATFAVAAMSYYLVERPFLRLKARFAGNPGSTLSSA